MMQNKKKYFLIGFIILWSFSVWAQVEFKLTAPKYVHKGESFKVSLTVNERPDERIEISEIKDFQIVMGPSLFSNSRTLLDSSGKITSIKSFTYSYILLAEKVGKFTIPSQTVVVKGKTYESSPHEIEVLESNEDSESANTTNQNTSSNNAPKTITPSKNTQDNFFVKVLLNKKKAYTNEYIIATLKIYTRYSAIANISPDLPSFKGFFSKEIPNSSDQNFNQEELNGTIYNTAVLAKYVLFPQQTGDISIEDFSVNAVVQQRVNLGRSLIDDFFGNNIKQFQVQAKSPKVTIKIEPLPANQPSSFMNGVGQFTINSSLSNDSITTNEAVTLKIDVKGNGNLQMLQAPKINFPPELEVYPPKTTHNSGITASGMNGSTSFEYLIIPRQEGDFILPEISFSYFNPTTRSYEEKKIKGYTLRVNKGKDNGTTNAIARYQNIQKDVTALGSDIKYIKTHTPKYTPINYYFINSLLFWILLIGSPLCVFIYFFFAKQQKARSANTLLNKRKRANKIAIKKLKTAKKSLEQNKKEIFYNHTLEALWGFLSDKLHLPTSQLNKENVYQLLVNQGVPEEDIKEYLEILNECEMAQYAPIASIDMKNSYEKAIAIISKIEQNIK